MTDWVTGYLHQAEYFAADVLYMTKCTQSMLLVCSKYALSMLEVVKYGQSDITLHPFFAKYFPWLRLLAMRLMRCHIQRKRPESGIQPAVKPESGDSVKLSLKSPSQSESQGLISLVFLTNTSNGFIIW